MAGFSLENYALVPKECKIFASSKCLFDIAVSPITSLKTFTFGEDFKETKKRKIGFIHNSHHHQLTQCLLQWLFFHLSRKIKMKNLDEMFHSHVFMGWYCLQNVYDLFVCYKRSCELHDFCFSILLRKSFMMMMHFHNFS